jgi:hypothetical protein
MCLCLQTDFRGLPHFCVPLWCLRGTRPSGMAFVGAGGDQPRRLASTSRSWLARSIGDLQDIVRTARARGAALKATEQPVDAGRRRRAGGLVRRADSDGGTGTTERCVAIYGGSTLSAGRHIGSCRGS